MIGSGIETILNEKFISRAVTAWKMSVFGVILVRIQSECVKIRTRKTPNTVNFYAVRGVNNCKKEKRFVALSYLADYFVKKENKAFTQKFPELV